MTLPGLKSWLWIRSLSVVFTVGVVGVVASALLWYLMLVFENGSFARELFARADNQARTLQIGIDDYLNRLYAVRAFAESWDKNIGRDKFEKFSKSLLHGHQESLNIAWIPRVNRNDRVSHEHAAIRDGLPDYHIRVIAPDGTLTLAPERDVYFPQFYSTETRTSIGYGLDLNDGGTQERTLNHMIDDNVLSASSSLVADIGSGGSRRLWVGLPVYMQDLPHATVEDRRSNLLGIVQGAFQIGAMIDAVLSGSKSPLRLYLFVPDAASDEFPVYYTSLFGTRGIEPRSQAQLAGGLYSLFLLNFGDTRWKLMVTPEPGGLNTTGHQRSWIVLICGLLLAGCTTIFTWTMRRDARNLQMANDRFETQNLRFDAALNNMAQGLLMYDSGGKLVISNRRFAEWFGVTGRQMDRPTLETTGPQAMQLVNNLTDISEKARAQLFAELQNILNRGTSGTIVFERTDGRTFSAACAPITDGGFVVTFENMTERRRAEEKISHMAHYDALTDLPNRVLFYEKMEECLRRGLENCAVAVFSLDLDRFKNVNDMLGHSVGDQLLQAVAARMRGCVRDTDVVARLGGDEFAILQVAFDGPTDASALATRLIDAVGAPYQFDGHEVIIGASIGIAIVPDDGVDPNQIMKNADLALYRSKADGGRIYRFFEEQMDAYMQERRALEVDLRSALATGAFTLNYQPIVNLSTGKVTTCEALIRWDRPGRGWMPPLEFIPIAEATGLIVPIGEWVIRRACADAADWPSEITIAVNVSPSQFKSVNFVDVVTNALERAGLPAKRLELEITELVLMQDNNVTLAVLQQLKALGVSIAMDDFGTGYSSLGYLRSFPFSKVKIDQSFIRDLSKNRDSLAILRAVVGLGRSLGIVTTAEGVETQNQLEVLQAEGCTEAQGYLFSRPKSLEEVRELLSSFNDQAKAVA
jgi:diguanylate cyclase (GGDEF)-like protein